MKSPNSRHLSRLLREALFQERHPELANAFDDHREAAARLDRRAFLKTSLALGLAAVPLASTIACATNPSRQALGPVDADPVVVLGGGLAGLTAAYRLAMAGQACVLYDAQTRLGGRIFTHRNFNREGMFCELGGELIDSSHEDMIGLAKELGLEIDDFMAYDKGLQAHHYYFSGRHRFDSDLRRACGPLVKKLTRDMKKVFRNLDEPNVGYRNPLPGAVQFDRISLEEYLHSVPGIEPWFRDAINMAYLTEFGLDTGEQSSINLMALITADRAEFGIYGQSDEGHRIRGGNSRLIEALASSVEARARVELDHRLVKIRDLGGSLELSFQNGSRTKTVRASRVICAIPFTILREVEGIGALALSPAKQRAIRELGYGTNAKRMLGFRERHWRKPNGRVPGMSGYTFTDLPSQTLWDSSRAQAGQAGIMTTFLGGSAGLDPQRGKTDSILSDLETMHPGCRQLFDGNEAEFRWATNPFVKGSYTCPRPGQYTTMMGAAKEAELGGRLLFAGEHVSETYQGYMNGAVQSGNVAARTILGVATPAVSSRDSARRSSLVRA